MEYAIALWHFRIAHIFCGEAASFEVHTDANRHIVGDADPAANDEPVKCTLSLQRDEQ